MSFSEVNILRKNGDLEAALKMANSDLDHEQSEWSFSALFWVLRDLCKKCLNEQNNDEAYSYFQQAEDILLGMNDNEGYAEKAIESLRKSFTQGGNEIAQLTALSKNGEEEKAYNGFCELNAQKPVSTNLHEDCGWIIFRYLKKYCSNIGSLKARKALFNYLQLKNKRPSLLHSQMLSVAMTVSENYQDFKFLPFLELWGADNFSDDDFYSSYYEDKYIDPLFERIVRRCFNLGYALNDVLAAFSNHSEIVLENYAKSTFFELSKHYKESNNKFFFVTANTYFDSVNGLKINTEFHSKILSLFLWRLSEERNSEVITAADKWGLQNFSSEDWQREKDKDDKSKEYPSLVEKLIKRYLEALKSIGLQNANDQFVSLLVQAADKYKDEQTERNLALIYAARGEKEKALAIYRKLLLSLNRFYVWKELADIADDNDLKISALCKAILSEPKDEFLGEVHLLLAKLLNANGLFCQAKRELETYRETYERNKWRLKSEYNALLGELPTDIIPSRNNDDFYNSHLDVAENFVYSDIPWETMLVSQLYTQKNDDGKEIKKAKLVSVKGDEQSIKQKQLQPSDSRFLGSCFDVKIYHDKIVLIKKSAVTIDQILQSFVGYIDYYNQDKKVYHIIDKEKKQYLLTTNVQLSVGEFCSCYAVPQKVARIHPSLFNIMRGFKKSDNKSSERPPLAIYAGTINQEQVIEDLPEKYALIDHINEEKQVYHCISTDGFGVVVPFEQMSFKPCVGDFVKIRFVDKNKNQLEKDIIRKLVSIQPTDSSEAILQFTLKTAVVDGVNESKQLFHCVFGTNMDIIIKFKDTQLRPSVGDYVLVRYAFQKGTDKTFRKMLDISMSEEGKVKLRKTITGHININSNSNGQRFGFVDDYYVGEKFLYDINDYDEVKIDVVYDGAKWRTYKLEKQ